MLQPFLAAAVATFPTGPNGSPAEPAAQLMGEPLELNLRGLLHTIVDSGQDDQPVNFRSVRIGADAHLPMALTVNLQGELVSEPRPELLDGQLIWEHYDYATVILGAGKVPFGRQNLVPTALLQIPERSPTVRRDREGGVVPDRRLGGTLGAELGLVAYALGLYAGQPGTVPDDGGGWLTALRFEMRPIGPIGIAESDWDTAQPWRSWPRIGLAGSFFHQRTEAFNRTGAGVDFAVKLLGLSVSTEALRTWTEDPAGTSVLTAAYGQAGYFIVPGLVEVAGRVGTSDPGDLSASAGAALWLAQTRARVHVFWQRLEDGDDVGRLDLIGWF